MLALPSPESALRLVQALELPTTDSPALAGIVVGAIAGIVVFVTVVALLARRASRKTERTAAWAAPDDVVFIPPYPVVGDAPFEPANALSARAFAKMGFAFGERVEGSPLEPLDVLEVLDRANESGSIEVDLSETGDAHAVTVAPVVVLKGPSPSSPDDSAPNPLAIIPASSSAMMRARELPELDYDDDGPTEIGEPYFDETPKPQAARAGGPKIRRVDPTPPRYVGAAIPPEPPTVPRLVDAP